MDAIQQMSRELSVLARAVAYSNLSVASGQVGLSQPQLSRIVARLEEALGVSLLDRSVRRTSMWTPMAHRISAIYSKTARHLQADLQKLVDADKLREVRIGTLEGLSSSAESFARKLFESSEARMVELDIFDLDVLEEEFTKDKLDFIFTIRLPGRKKFKFVRALGYQKLNRVERGKQFTVASPFEYSSVMKHKSSGKILVSNSLEIRKRWLERYGGEGHIPSVLEKTTPTKKDVNEVLLVGSEQLPLGYWRMIEKLEFWAENFRK